MNKPSAFTMFYGHILTVTALGALTFYLGWQWVTVDADVGWLCIPAFLATISSRTAYHKARNYQLWKREWDGMGGSAPGVRLSSTASRRIVGGLAWLAMACVTIAVSDDPSAATGVGLFWLASIGALVIAIIRWLLRAATGGAQRGGKHLAVRVCLPVARQSATLEQAYQAMPDHCRGLFQ